MTPPALGVGTVYIPGLEPLFQAGGDLIDVVEVEPQLFREGDGRYRLHQSSFAMAAALGKPFLIHGVGFPVGGTVRPGEQDLAPYVEAVVRSGSPWASEHLSFNELPGRGSAAGRFGGFLLPPVQSPLAVSVAAANIRAVQDLLPVPFAFETGVNYLRPQRGEMRDGEFFAAVAEEADCGILLDLHNLLCNQRNGRQAVLDAVGELPLERVWEVHLAGGVMSDGLWLDSHGGAPPEEVYELAEQVLPALPNLGAVIFEVMPEHIARGRFTPAEGVEQLHRVRDLWDRARAVRNGPQPSARERIVAADGPPCQGPATALPDPAAWESLLGALVIGEAGSASGPGAGPVSEAAAALSQDRSLPVIRRIVASFRSVLVVETLPLTFRLIMFAVGEEGFLAMMSAFWAGYPPRRFASEELDDFLAFIRAQDATPHLREVAAYEVAAARVRATGVAESVVFSCEPTALLAALRQYREPTFAGPGEYEVTVVP
ncbi:DUF692 family multinuclear iron-containing protein [Streptomyces sp. NPDC049040]|uniref:DUF692 domain-containing protein n=1 Tax=Streptomyces sp. NPDC049040 TaxID=3365593 RepID=UPI00371E93C1